MEMSIKGEKNLKMNHKKSGSKRYNMAGAPEVPRRREPAGVHLISLLSAGESIALLSIFSEVEGNSGVPSVNGPKVYLPSRLVLYLEN